MSKLEFAVNIADMIDWPVVSDVPVNTGTVGSKFRTWLHKLEQEMSSVVSLRICACMDCISKLSRSCLFAEHEEPFVEKGFIELNQAFQNMRLIREAGAKLIEPVSYGLLGQVRQAHGLPDGNLGGPRPEDSPKLFQWQFHVREPGMGEEAEALATVPAAIS